MVQVGDRSRQARDCRSTARSAPTRSRPATSSIIPDLTADPRTSDNPLVTGGAGLPLLRRRGDPRPHGHPARRAVRARPDRPARTGSTTEQTATLAALARQISSLLEHRRTLAEVAAREAEIAASERRFRVMTSAMPQMVWTTLPDGFHDYLQRPLVRVHRRALRLHRRRGLERHVPSRRPGAGLDAAGATRLETGEPYEIEYRLRHRGGDYRWTLGRAMPIRDADGRIERWFGTCTDIDDLKRAEAEARKLAAIVETSKDFIGLCHPGRPDHASQRGRRGAWSGCPTSPPRAGTGLPDLFTDGQPPRAGRGP